MKKILIFAAAAAMLVACEKPENGAKLPSTPDIKDYKTVEIAGNTWMAENLHFVPDGMTVSENAAEGNLWYPADAGKGTALKDEAAVKELGLLYDHFTALGIDKAKVDELVKANDEKGLETYLKSFEGAQGVCPEGWHIPTATECVAAFGKGIGSIKTNVEAPLYNKTLDCGSLTLANAAGFNFQPAGFVFKSGFATAGAYNKLTIADSKEEWNGKNKMTYQISSTLYKVNTKDNAISNCQFFGLMTNFASKYAKEGAFNLSYNAIGSGCVVRCVKNK